MMEFFKDSLAVLLALAIAFVVVLIAGAIMVVQVFLGTIMTFLAVGGLAYVVIGSWLFEKKSKKQPGSNHRPPYR